MEHRDFLLQIVLSDNVSKKTSRDHFIVSAQSCLTLCNPMDCSPLGSSVHVFSRQEYWSGLPFPAPGDIPNPRVECVSPVFPALAGKFFATVPPGRPLNPVSPPSTQWAHHELNYSVGILCMPFLRRSVVKTASNGKCSVKGG